MKKILLLAVAAFMAVSANAQLADYSKVGKPQSGKKVVSVESVKAPRFEAVAARNAAAQDESRMGQQVAKKAIKHAKMVKRNAETEFVSEVAYTGIGKAKSDSKKYTWTMELGKYGEFDVVRDIVPTIFNDGELDVVATRNGNTITIEPQKIAETERYKIYIESSTTEDGVITLTLDAQKHIALPDGEGILLGAFEDEYDPDHGAGYLGYYEIYNNITYYASDEQIPVPAPAVYVDGTSRGMLYAGMGRSGYSFTYNLCTLPSDCDFTFTNYTSDDANVWKWNADVMGEETVESQISGSEYDFTFNVENNVTLSNINVVGSNLGNESSPFVVSAGAGKEIAYFYGSGAQDQFEFTDGTCATMTLNDPNNTIKFYTNWATPDIYSTSISKIYAYGFKPIKPLFITGINIPVVSFEARKGFELTCKIVQAQREGGSQLILGDVIAQCTITDADVDMTYAEEVGLAVLQFDNLKVLDEDGMETEVDHLFLEEEFAVVIEGWDNGTFSAVIASQEDSDDNAPTSTWFEQTKKPGSKYSYGSWPTLFIGYTNATYGYLSTDDDTNVELPAEGGNATLTVHPMYSNNPESGEELTRLFIEGEMPEWVTIEITNEDYVNDYKFDLVVSAEALPAGEEAREADVRLWQEGAILDLHITQGAGTGINTVVTKVTKTGKTYNLAGQEITGKFKGVAIRNGQKFMNK